MTRYALPPDAGRAGRRGRGARPRRLGRAAARLLAVVLALGVLEGLAAAPAGADGSRPTNFESRVDRVDPDAEGVQVEVVGGDAFLRVVATRGTEVLVPGYDGEPYLRIDADGSVHRNERSPATHLNLSRDGSVAGFPDEVGAKADPRWVRVGDGGEVAWHDHRIHWMVTDAPAVGEDRVVQKWSVPLVVDGDEVEVSGRLLLLEDRFPWAAAVAAVAFAGSVLLAARDRARRPLLAAASAVAVGLAVATYAENPPGSGASVVPIVLAGLALALAVAAPLVPDALRPVVLPLGSVAALLGWVVGRIGVLWMPVVPSLAPDWVERAGTGAVLGVALGVAVAVLIRPVPLPAGSAPGGPGRAAPGDAAVASPVDG